MASRLFPAQSYLAPTGVRASNTAFALLKSKLAQTSGNIVFRGDSNSSKYSGADNNAFMNVLPMELERSLFSSGVFANSTGPNNVTVIPFFPDTASNNLADSPNFESTQLKTFGGVRVIGPESNENYVVGSPFAGWIQPRTPGSDDGTAGTGFCMEVRLNTRAGDSTARVWSRNATKFSICYELRRSGTVSISAGNQPGYDDSNASIGGGVTYGSSYNQAESLNLTCETTADTSFGASPSGIQTNFGNIDVAFTGGGQDHVGPMWSRWYQGVNAGNRDKIIRIKVPTGSAIRLFGIAIATANAKGLDSSGVDASSPSWSFWDFSRAGQCIRHYSPSYDASRGSVSLAQLYRRWFGSVVNLFGTPMVSGSSLSGATSLPNFLAAGVDIIIDTNFVNDVVSQASSVANIKAYTKNCADAAALLGIVFVKVLPCCPSGGAGSEAAKNASATAYAQLQTAMRELTVECPNFVLVDTWEALSNPIPTDQFVIHKLHPGFTINGIANYNFDGMHFSAAWRSLAVSLVSAAFKFAKQTT